MAGSNGFVYINVTEDNFDKLIQVLEDLNNYAVEVGVFASDDSFYAMIANVHEYGMTIKAKKKFMTIPTREANGRKAADIPGLFKPKDKNILAVQEGNRLIVMFFLVKSVTIPERSFVRSTFDEKNDEWINFMESLIEKLLSFEIDAKTLFDRVGARAAADIQEKITTLRTPANSTITAKNKGSSNPLVDTGGLRARVTWRVVKSNA
ncbi:hypothetical protein ACTHAL_001459 [Priestia flexa]|uniref:hypothetical protein n=1 Tax=Priestia flexa TaxID=86664 RepID=UPI003F871E15